MFCKNCGRLLPDDEKICYSCGARVSGAKAPGKGMAAGAGLQTDRPERHGRKVLAAVIIAMILIFGLIYFGIHVIKNLYIQNAEETAKKRYEEIAEEDDEDIEEEEYPEETEYAEAYDCEKDSESGGNISDDTGTEEPEADGTASEDEEEDYIITQLRKIQTPDITVPYSAEVKTDTRISDLIGEYEGEIQFTLIKGFENMPGASEDVPDMVQAGLDAPSPCTLEIKEDGDWILFLDYMYGMTMTGSAYKIYDPKTPEEENAHLIHDIEDGRFYVMTIVEGDGNYGRVENNGICCEQYGKKVIYGYFRADLAMREAKVVLAGFYTVYAE